MSKTVYISIGNSDDKLTQEQWRDFIWTTGFNVTSYATTVHGIWYSAPVSEYQNACWCIEIEEEHKPLLKKRFANMKASFQQEWIAWAEATTEFI